MTLRFKNIDDVPLDLRQQVTKAMTDTSLRNSAVATPAAESKYHSRHTPHKGVTYASKLEARCAAWLDGRKLNGEVWFWLRQVRFPIEGGTYVADFVAFLNPSHAVPGFEVIEAKGYDIADGRRKRRQVRERYGIEVRVWPERAI